MKIYYQEILDTSFFEAVVDTQCLRRVGTLYLNQMNITYELLALQLDTNRRDGEKMEDRRWGGREGEWKGGRNEEVRQGRKEESRQEERKEGGTEAGRRKGQPSDGIRAVEFQPDFKTIQIWSNI